MSYRGGRDGKKKKVNIIPAKTKTFPSCTSHPSYKKLHSSTCPEIKTLLEPL
jgi:hypothetical protein